MGNKYWMYLSLWREHGGAPGMGVFSLDAETGELEFRDQPNNRVSFGCSCVDPKRGVLYVCNEAEKVFGTAYETGRIYGYRISPETGELTELFHLDTYCPNPCYIGLDPGGEYLVVSHHSVSGVIARLERGADGKYTPVPIYRQAYLQLYALNESGTPGELLDVKTHEISPDSKPYGSFLHSAVFSPSGKLIAVCDKGDRSVYLYAIDRERQELKLLNRMPTGMGEQEPRYCVFHPTKPYFVVNHEQLRGGRMTVACFRYTEEGAMEMVSSADVLPDGCVPPPWNHYEQQGLCISADGAYVYTCLNGPNAICVLALDGENGTLRVVQHQPLAGEWPRGLALAPGGKILAASCLVSGDVSTFAVGPDGLLTPTGASAKLRGGAFMSFFPSAV